MGVKSRVTVVCLLIPLVTSEEFAACDGRGGGTPGKSAILLGKR